MSLNQVKSNFLLWCTKVKCFFKMKAYVLSDEYRHKKDDDVTTTPHLRFVTQQPELVYVLRKLRHVNHSFCNAAALVVESRVAVELDHGVGSVRIGLVRQNDVTLISPLFTFELVVEAHWWREQLHLEGE